MTRAITAAAACVLLCASAASPQAPANPGLVLRPPASAAYPSGSAVIDYSLARPADTVEIDVLDSKGATVAGWSGGPKYRQGDEQADRMPLPSAMANPGVNKVTWDLRATGYFAVGAEGAPPKYSPGPLVPPGRYTVQVKALGETVSQPLAIVSSLPLSEARAGDLQARFELALKIRGSASAANAAVRRVRAMKARVKARLKETTDATAVETGQALLRRLDEIEGAPTAAAPATAGVAALRRSLASLEGSVDAGSRPADVQADQYRTLSGALQERIFSLNSLSSGSFARFERGEAPAPPPAAFGATTIKFDAAGADFGSWVRAFMASVNRNWTIPKASLAGPGHVVVTFVAHRSGSITDITVSASSGVAAYDESARKAVFAASLAEPLPEAYKPATCSMAVTFYFNERPQSATIKK